MLLRQREKQSNIEDKHSTREDCGTRERERERDKCYKDEDWLKLRIYGLFNRISSANVNGSFMVHRER